VESLKDRYYSVARTILESRKMFDHPIIKSGYNYEQEMKRRTYLEKTMNKSFAELREENNLFEMAENLNRKMEKNEKFENAIHQKLNELKMPNINANNLSNNNSVNNTIHIPMTIDETENTNNLFSENKNLINQINNNENLINLNYKQTNKMNIEPFSSNNESNQTFEDFIKNNITRNDSFVYLRSQKLKHNLPVSEKIQERVDNYMKEFNIQQKSLMPTAKVEIAYDNLRNNIILYTSLKKYLEKKDKEFNYLQTKFKEYQNKKNPPQGNNNMTSHPQINKSTLKSDKNNPQVNKTNSKAIIQNEVKEEASQEVTTNKTITASNTVNINNANKANIIPTNIINPANNNEINNPIINNNTNISLQDSTKQPGTKEKKRKINGTPKARKRKNMNEDEAPANEEKEPKNNSKKKKKGTK
jgi:hypothetical protein